MVINETVEAIIKGAKLKRTEEQALVLRFGLRGETKTLVERVAMFKADPLITVKIDRDWVRRQDANAVLKMRSAILRLKVNIPEFKEACQDEPYISLCDVLFGFDPNK